MKLKHFFTLVVALFTLTMVFSACSSDDEDDKLLTSVPDEMVGTWEYSVFTLELKNDGTGGLTYYDYDDGRTAVFFKVSRTTTEYKLFNYTFGSQSKNLNITSVSEKETITFKNLHIENNKLVLTYTDENGVEKTEAGTQVTDDGSNFGQD